MFLNLPSVPILDIAAASHLIVPKAQKFTQNLPIIEIPDFDRAVPTTCNHPTLGIVECNRRYLLAWRASRKGKDELASLSRVNLYDGSGIARYNLRYDLVDTWATRLTRRLSFYTNKSQHTCIKLEFHKAARMGMMPTTSSFFRSKTTGLVLPEIMRCFCWS